MKRKFLKAIALVSALCLLMTACSGTGTENTSASGSEGTSSEQDASQTGEKVSLDLWWWQSEMEQPWNDGVFADFEAANPSVDVTLSMYPWSNYWQKIQTAMISDTLPDLIMMSVGYIDKYAEAGAVINLKDYIDRDLDRSLYYELGFETVRWPDMETGDEYAMPWNVETTCLFYNQTLFDEAGLAYPDDTWTWETLRENAIKLTKNTDDMTNAQYGFSMGGVASENSFDSLIYSFGGRVISEDLQKCMLDQPEAQEAVQFLADMILVDKCMPPVTADGDAGSDFASGRVAMEINGLWAIDSVEGSSEINWNVAPLPIGPAGRKTRSWSDSICISTSCKNPDQAWEFIKYLVSDEGQTVSTLSPTRVPILIEKSLDDEWLNSSGEDKNKKQLIELLDEGSPFVFCNNWGEWSAALANEIFPAFTGEKSVEETLQSATAAVDQILEKGYQE